MLDLFPQAGVGRGWQADVNAVLVAGDGATGHVGDEAAGSQAQITLDVHEGLRVFEKLMSDGVSLVACLRQTDSGVGIGPVESYGGDGLGFSLLSQGLRDQTGFLAASHFDVLAGRLFLTHGSFVVVGESDVLDLDVGDVAVHLAVLQSDFGADFVHELGARGHQLGGVEDGDAVLDNRLADYLQEIDEMKEVAKFHEDVSHLLRPHPELI